MKFNKLSKFFLLTLLANSSTFFELTSCNLATADLDANIIKSYEQFISDRTFSLLCGYICTDDRNGNIYSVTPIGAGTCWIIDKVTPSDENDFRYYVATNLHVAAPIQKLITQPDPAPSFFMSTAAKVGVGDRNYGTTPTQFVNPNNITWLDKSEFKIENIDSNFVFFGNNCIDMSVCSIDFSRVTGETKNKLIRLNNFRKENGYINKFPESDDVSIIKKDKYIAGYPAHDFVPTWQFRRISGHDLQFYDDIRCHHSIDPDFNKNKLKNKNQLHKYSNYTDISFQYVFNEFTPRGWLGRGASGSMLITEDYEVCGMYWGGFSMGTYLFPCFSLFNTSCYDFISKWLNKG